MSLCCVLRNAAAPLHQIKIAALTFFRGLVTRNRFWRWKDPLFWGLKRLTPSREARPGVDIDAVTRGSHGANWQPAQSIG